MTTKKITDDVLAAGKTLENPPVLGSPGSSVGGASKREQITRQLELQKLKEEKLRMLEEKSSAIKNLPHRHGYKKYPWQREFFDSFEKQIFLTAANQVGKSTIMVSQMIEWAGNVNLWSRLWKGKRPRQFWYLYPDFDFATSEVEEKWIPDLLPRDEMKDHPTWGWELRYKDKKVHSIKFNSGVTIYFKAYSQSIKNLQGSTVAAIFADEELPEEFWDELMQRLHNMRGYYRSAFTATLGQKLWYDTMERQGTPQEKFPDAKKMQISLYDCKTYEDNSPSHIDDDYIRRAILLCKNEAEIQKRVMGRFALSSGLKYPTFERKGNMVMPYAVLDTWPIYIGVDIGSGGTEGDSESRNQSHPSAIVMCAVSPDYTQAVAFDGWVGLNEVTTDVDVYEKLIALLEKNNCEARVGGIFYDYHAKDFGTICTRKGLAVLKADKSHDVGESVLNVLFKIRNLTIFDVPQFDELAFELTNLKQETAKRHARDDYVDALRYCLSRVPFDWAKLGINLTQPQAVREEPLTREQLLAKERRSYFNRQKEEQITIGEELEAWNEHFDF